MAYVYIRSEPGLRTVGFYRPDGTWEPESDHDSPDKAAARVAYLNGGGAALELLDAARAMLQEADTFHDDTAHYVEVRRLAVEALRAAIAKAEGR